MHRIAGRHASLTFPQFGQPAMAFFDTAHDAARLKPRRERTLNSLALPLFVTRIAAHNVDDAPATDDFAVFTNPFDACTNFHGMPPRGPFVKPWVAFFSFS